MINNLLACSVSTPTPSRYTPTHTQCAHTHRLPLHTHPSPTAHPPPPPVQSIVDTAHTHTHTDSQCTLNPSPTASTASPARPHIQTAHTASRPLHTHTLSHCTLTPSPAAHLSPLRFLSLQNYPLPRFQSPLIPSLLAFPPRSLPPSCTPTPSLHTLTPLSLLSSLVSDRNALRRVVCTQVSLVDHPAGSGGFVCVRGSHKANFPTPPQ
eukprot:3789507-Rhodomonas_salina.1